MLPFNFPLRVLVCSCARRSLCTSLSVPLASMPSSSSLESLSSPAAGQGLALADGPFVAAAALTWAALLLAALVISLAGIGGVGGGGGGGAEEALRAAAGESRVVFRETGKGNRTDAAAVGPPAPPCMVFLTDSELDASYAVDGDAVAIDRILASRGWGSAGRFNYQSNHNRPYVVGPTGAAVQIAVLGPSILILDILPTCM